MTIEDDEENLQDNEKKMKEFSHSMNVFVGCLFVIFPAIFFNPVLTVFKCINPNLLDLHPYPANILKLSNIV